MKPTIARMVVVLGVLNAGTNVAPAVITRVWGDGDTLNGPVLVNLHAFGDWDAPSIFTSVPLFDTAGAAAEHHRLHGAPAAHWPERDAVPAG